MNQDFALRYNVITYTHTHTYSVSVWLDQSFLISEVTVGILTGCGLGLTSDRHRKRRRCLALPSAMTGQPSKVLGCENALHGISGTRPM